MNKIEDVLFRVVTACSKIIDSKIASYSDKYSKVASSM